MVSATLSFFSSFFPQYIHSLWSAETRTRAAIQQADALLTELRCTLSPTLRPLIYAALSDLRRTLYWATPRPLSYAASSEQCRSLLSYAAPIELLSYCACLSASRLSNNWATPHPLSYGAPSKICRTFWATPHPTEQRCTLLATPQPSALRRIILSYWAIEPASRCTNNWALTHPLNYGSPSWASPHPSELPRTILSYWAIEPAFQQADALTTELRRTLWATPYPPEIGRILWTTSHPLGFAAPY